MKLVVAEKPSVARAIAAAVGADAKDHGYLEGKGWLVTWCRGHLVDLALPDEYPQWKGAWDESKLPMIPFEWIWRPSSNNDTERQSTAEQLRAVTALMQRGDVEVVINACDADREGEGIFRRVYGFAACEKPVKRFWSTALTEEAVIRDLKNMRDDSEYDGLADAAEGRAKADWLVGLNATRAYTCLAGTRITVGRVQTPVLAMVVQRTRQIAAFEPRDFFCATATCKNGLVLEGERLGSESAAQSTVTNLKRAGDIEVVKAEYKDVRTKAPALFDLTALQRAASERYGMSADVTLAVMQALYEAKLLTYPRTDSRYITADDLPSAQSALLAVACEEICGKAACEMLQKYKADLSQIVCDEKVSGHTAVMPTSKLDAHAFARLTEEQQRICRLVSTRLVAAVMPPATKRKASVEAKCAEYKTMLRAASTTVTEASWLAIDDASQKDTGEPKPVVPEGLVEGQVFTIESAGVKKGRTAPPKPYTDSTLLSAMENCGKHMTDAELAAAINDDTMHSGGLGTPATRAEIIKKLVSCGYVLRRGKMLKATEAGMAVIDAVDETLKTPELTAKWELKLAAVERSEESLDAFLESIEAHTVEIVEAARSSMTEERALALRGAAGGWPRPLPECRCPRCGADVLEGKWKASCSTNRYSKGADGKYKLDAGCGWEMQCEIAHKRLTPVQMAKIIKGDYVPVRGMKKKTGEKFAAMVHLADDGKEGKLELGYTRGAELPGCRCPECGGEVERYPDHVECSEGCGWYMWSSIARKQLGDRQLERIICGETIKVKGLKARTGKVFAAWVKLDESGRKLELEFD